MSQATGHPLVAIMAECDEDGSLDALRAVRDAASYKSPFSSPAEDDGGGAHGDDEVAAARQAAVTSDDPGAVGQEDDTTVADRAAAATSSAIGARRIEAFVKQSQALVCRVSTPDRIRRRTAQLSRDIAEMAARQRARHARHLQDTQPQQPGGLLTRPARDTTTKGARARNEEAMPPTCGESGNGTAPTRLPNLRKSFEAARQHYLLEAQREHTRFPPIQQPRIFSEKDPDAFSLRFQPHTADVREMTSPFARTDASLQASSTSSFASCLSVDTAISAAPETPCDASETPDEARLMRYGALHEQRRSAKREAALAETERICAEEAAAASVLEAERAAVHAEAMCSATPPPDVPSAPGRQCGPVAPYGAETTAMPRISRRSAQLAAARRRRDGVTGLSVTERLSRRVEAASRTATVAAAACGGHTTPADSAATAHVSRSIARARQGVSDTSHIAEARLSISTTTAQLRRRPGHNVHVGIYDEAKVRQREAAAKPPPPPGPACTFQPIDVDDKSVRLGHPAQPSLTHVALDSSGQRAGGTPPAQIIDPDCTLTPTLNSDYCPGDAATAPPLPARIQSWHARREHKLDVEQRLCHEGERRECSFRPCILHI